MCSADERRGAVGEHRDRRAGCAPTAPVAPSRRPPTGRRHRAPGGAGRRRHPAPVPIGALSGQVLEVDHTGRPGSVCPRRSGDQFAAATKSLDIGRFAVVAVFDTRRRRGDPAVQRHLAARPRVHQRHPMPRRSETVVYGHFQRLVAQHRLQDWPVLAGGTVVRWSSGWSQQR